MNDRWLIGIPMTIDIFQSQVLIHVLTNKNDIKYNSIRYMYMYIYIYIYIHSYEHIKNMFIFINRSLEYSNLQKANYPYLNKIN